jgi:hypothetical protein
MFYMLLHWGLERASVRWKVNPLCGFETLPERDGIGPAPFEVVHPGPVRDAFGTQGQEQTDKG